MGRALPPQFTRCAVLTARFAPVMHGGLVRMRKMLIGVPHSCRLRLLMSFLRGARALQLMGPVPRVVFFRCATRSYGAPVGRMSPGELTRPEHADTLRPRPASAVARECYSV